MGPICKCVTEPAVLRSTHRTLQTLKCQRDMGQPAYHTVMGWISEHGHEIAGPPRETYLNDPQTVPPEELLTRVEFPIFSDVS